MCCVFCRDGDCWFVLRVFVLMCLRGKKGDGLGEIEMLGNYGANSRFSFEKQK